MAKAQIFENVDDLNNFIADKKKMEVQHHFQVVGSKKDASGQEQLIVLDRFLVLIEEK